MVEYSVDVTLYASINYYDVSVSDLLPTGATLIEESVVGPTVTNEAGDEYDVGTWSKGTSGTTHTWTLGQGGDIGSAPVNRTLSLTYQVLLCPEVDFAMNALPNTASFNWASRGGGPPQGPITDEANVTVENPALNITKKVEGEDSITRNPDASFEYSVTVTNTGTTAAHHMTVVDEVPAGVTVDPSSITGGGELTGANATTGGGTITWTIAGPLHEQGTTETPTSLNFTYEATFAGSEELDGEVLENVAAVTHFESFPRDPENPGEPTGREYTPGENGQDPITDNANVRPVYPFVVLEKSVTDGNLAHVDESFGWTLNLVNTGEGSAQTIDVTDTLPTNWDYDAGSAMISIGGAAAVALEDPTEAADGDRTTLTWNLGEADAEPLLPGDQDGATPAQRSIVITFTATPNADAVDEAAVGIGVNPHVNDLTAITTDTTGSPENSEGPFTGPDDEAQAFLGSADLTITKTGADAPLVAGETAVGWTVTVTNNGPDTADGSITVSDVTDALPEGITITNISGEGWTCEAPERDADTGVTAFECERTDTTESLATGASFPVIEIEVAVADDQQAVEDLENTATVNPGRTYDPDPENNEDKDPISTTTSADLAIEKSVSTAEPNAGAAITWQIAPTNLGPSVSVSTEGDPITFSGEIPAGITGVTDPSNDSWVATTSGSGWPAAAGDTITWTYVGDSMPVGPSESIELTGTIEASWTDGEILNTATITPGPTDDPVEPNNTSNVPVTPGDDTTLGITKTRVAPDGAGGWESVTDTNYVPGDPVHYLVTVVNQGPADARNVQVVDEVPAGLTHDTNVDVEGEWIRTPGGTSTDGSSGEWDTFTLSGTQQVGADFTTSFVVTYNTDPALDPDEDIVNWVEATADNSTNTPRDDDSSRSDRVADLSIEKTHTGNAVAGETLDYTITVTNNGPSVSSGPIEIADELPAGFSYVPGSALVTVAGGAATATDPSVSDQTLTWSVGDAEFTLAPSATIVITLTTAIDPAVPAQTALVNAVTVDGPDDDDPTNNYDEDPTDVERIADMTIVKDVEAGPWIAGTSVEYTITVTNEGPSVADATVTDVLPAGLTANDISGSAGWDCELGSLTCEYASHPVGAANASTITVIVDVASNVPTGTALENIAELEWTDSRGPHEGEDPAEITVTTLADLALVKTAIDENGEETSTAIAGEESTYRISVSNNGPSDVIAPVTVEDTLPAGISFVGLTGGSSSNWSAEAEAIDEATGTQTVLFTLTPEGSGLANGVTAPVIEFDVLVDAAAEQDDTLTNTATVASGTPESDETNNTDTAPLEVNREVDVAIEKSLVPNAVRIGDELPFSLDVVNNGPSEATGITVTDDVPEGLDVLTEVGELGEGWTIDEISPNDDGSTYVVASYEYPLAPGESAPTLTITTLVTPVAYQTVTNVAIVSSNEPDRVPENNTTENPVVVPPMVELVVEKNAIGDFQVGETGTFEISLVNNGPTEDPGPITVTDVLPDGLTFNSSPDDGVQVDGNTVTWTLQDGLQVGESVTLTLVVNVQQGAYPEVTNSVTVDSAAEKTPESVLADSVTVNVGAADPLPITGGDMAALAMLIALLLLLGGTAAVLHARRKAALAEVAE